MKQFLSFLLALCLLLSLCACGKPEPVQDAKEDTHSTAATDPAPSETDSVPSEPETDQNDPPEPASSITPILYKLTDSDGNTAWLFGSIHVGQEHYYPLPDYITSAYENADALAVECDVVSFASDIGAQTDAVMKLLYMDGTKISDHIPEDLYTQAVEVMKDAGLYMSAFDMYYPILWSNLIETSMYESFGVDSELGIDMHFLNDAHKTDKEIHEVESATFQYELMAGFSDELQIILLGSALHSYDNMDEAETELMKLAEAWASGDEDTLVEILTEEPEFESDEEALLYAEYTDAMMTQRNVSMADFAEDALESGKEVFICVGAAHIVGPGAMVDLLTQRGYTLERVVP